MSCPSRGLFLLAAGCAGAGLAAIHVLGRGEEVVGPARLLAIPISNSANPPPDTRAALQRVGAADHAGASSIEVITPPARGRSASRPRGTEIVLIIGAEWRVRFLDRPTSVPTRALLPNELGAPSLIPSDLGVWRAIPLAVAVPSEDDGSPRSTLGRDGRFPAIVQDLNRTLGLEVFRLAARQVADRAREGVVHVVSLSSDQRRQGRTRLGPRRCVYDSAHGYACHPRWIGGAEIGLAATAGPAEIHHELLHAFGLTHTCVVPSIMATEFAREELEWCARMRRSLGFDQPLRLRRQMSEFDVAALEIVRNVARALEGRSGTSLHWVVVPPSGLWAR